jgi:hypothetical protein
VTTRPGRSHCWVTSTSIWSRPSSWPPTRSSSLRLPEPVSSSTLAQRADLVPGRRSETTSCPMAARPENDFSPKPLRRQSRLSRRPTARTTWSSASATLPCSSIAMPWLSRSGGRCRDYSRSVSPGRSPNPPYRFPGNGLSTVSAVQAWLGSAQGIGDLAAAIPVSGDRDRCDVEQFDPVHRRASSTVAAGEVTADVFHFQRRSRIHHRITLCHTNLSREPSVCCRLRA